MDERLKGIFSFPGGWLGIDCPVPGFLLPPENAETGLQDKMLRIFGKIPQIDRMLHEEGFTPFERAALYMAALQFRIGQMPEDERKAFLSKHRT